MEGEGRESRKEKERKMEREGKESIKGKERKIERVKESRKGKKYKKEG